MNSGRAARAHLKESLSPSARRCNRAGPSQVRHGHDSNDTRKATCAANGCRIQNIRNRRRIRAELRQSLRDPGVGCRALTLQSLSSYAPALGKAMKRGTWSDGFRNTTNVFRGHLRLAHMSGSMLGCAGFEHAGPTLVAKIELFRAWRQKVERTRHGHKP